MKRIAHAFLILLVTAAGGAAQAALPWVGENGEVPSLAPLVNEVGPAVVNISTTGTVDVEQSPFFRDPFFRRFFDMPQMPQRREVHSLGSGVIVNAAKGYILTNHHVIARADEIRVRLQDNREFDAEVVGSDPRTDIALIRIDADNLTEIPLGDSSRLQVGDFVLAIGNPFGLDHTVTSGVVSGLGRSLPGGAAHNRLQNFIQTDASINPGNSGGALVGLNGKLVGINTAILSRTGGNIGIGFAVPINMARQVMEQLAEHGEVQRGVLGVRIQDLTPEMAEAFGVEAGGGALVAQVVPGSAADEAGIRQGDVVTRVNGKPVGDAQDLANAVGLLKIGDAVKLEIVRDGESMTVNAKVGQPLDGTQEAASGLHPALEGARFADLGGDAPSDVSGGVRVTDVAPGSPAAETLRPGDIITSVNRQPVADLSEFRNAVKDQKTLLLNIRRGDVAMFVLLR